MIPDPSTTSVHVAPESENTDPEKISTVPEPTRVTAGLAVSIINDVKKSSLLIPSPSSTVIEQFEYVPSAKASKVISLSHAIAILVIAVQEPLYIIDPVESELNTYVGVLLLDTAGIGTISTINAIAFTFAIGFIIIMNAGSRIIETDFLKKLRENIYGNNKDTNTIPYII